jgi:hypothetical protein
VRRRRGLPIILGCVAALVLGACSDDDDDAAAGTGEDRPLAAAPVDFRVDEHSQVFRSVVPPGGEDPISKVQVVGLVGAASGDGAGTVIAVARGIVRGVPPQPSGARGRCVWAFELRAGGTATGSGSSQCVDDDAPPRTFVTHRLVVVDGLPLGATSVEALCGGARVRTAPVASVAALDFADGDCPQALLRVLDATGGILVNLTAAFAA